MSDLPLYYVYLYIYTIIIISILIFVNAVYNILVYINIILNKYSDDVVLTENNKLSNKEGYEKSKLLIGDTVDYKLFISTFIDNHFNYCDKYFTLNITRSLLKLFIIFTIISIAFIIIASLWCFIGGKNDCFYACVNNIKKNCYFIKDDISSTNYDIWKLGGIGGIIFILFLIFGLDLSIRSTIYETYIVEYDREKKDLDVVGYKYKNIETYLNTYIGTSYDANEHVLDATSNDNIDVLINHLKGYNIHTIKNIKDIKNSTNDTKYNLFIGRVKEICARIADRVDKNNIHENKDLDFVNLVIIFLNNMKIFNDKRKQNISTKIDFLSVSTFLNDIINVITNVIPVFPGIQKIKDDKIDAYNIYNILIGGIPLSLRENILKDNEENCIDIIKYEETISNISTDKDNDTYRKKCIYYNYLYDLKNISKYEPFKHNLKNTLITILSFAILSVIIIILLLIYIYINFSREHVNWSKEISIHLIRSANYKTDNKFLLGFIINCVGYIINLGYLGLGYIIDKLINK